MLVKKMSLLKVGQLFRRGSSSIWDILLSFIHTEQQTTFLYVSKLKYLLTSSMISLSIYIETENRAKRSSYALAAMKQPL